jgi:hypothetical protein
MFATRMIATRAPEARAPNGRQMNDFLLGREIGVRGSRQ